MRPRTGAAATILRRAPINKDLEDFVQAELAQLGSNGNGRARDHASEPAHLFHLVDAAGIDSVVRRRTLPALDWRLGHDAALVGYGVELVTDFLTARQNQAMDALREQFRSAALANFNPRGTHFDGFVARLFERIDAADPATFPGYALGLSVGALSRFALQRAIYSRAQQLAIVESVYQRCEDYFVSAVQRFGERHSAELLPPCWDKFRRNIGTFLMRFRCPSRVNEGEWIALAIISRVQQNKDAVTFQIVDNCLVPTFVCDIAGSLAIIAIGASLPFATTREALLAYLGRNRMSGVAIVSQQSMKQKETHVPAVR